MSHEILGNRFISRALPAWHNLAQRIFPADTEISASEAVHEVAGDIEIVKVPMFYRLDEREHAADTYAIVRRPTHDSPDPVQLGTTAETWVAAGYPQLAEAIDPLSRTHPVETAGTLRDGGLVFLCLRGPDWDVAGDGMRTYFAVNFSLVPGIGHRVLLSPVRVVCMNTNTMAQASASINLSVPHTTDSVQRLELAGNLVLQLRGAQEEARSIFQLFADRQVTPGELEAIAAAAYPSPALPGKWRAIAERMSPAEIETFLRSQRPAIRTGWEAAAQQYVRETDRILRTRDAVTERFEAFEPANLRGTVWAAYNAVTEVADWREGRNADEAAVLGVRAQEKRRAFAAAYDLIQK